MSKFNLKKAEDSKNNLHNHIENRLKTLYHKNDTEVSTENLLKNHHDKSLNYLLENQLHSKRQEDYGTIESRLSNKKDFRDSTKYSGNINKLEETRMNKKIEKYEPANIKPKNLRWWEKANAENLKVAQTITNDNSNDDNDDDDLSNETPLNKKRWWKKEPSSDGLILKAQRYKPVFGPENYNIFDEEGEYQEDFEKRNDNKNYYYDDLNDDNDDDENLDVFDIYDNNENIIEYKEFYYKEDLDTGNVIGKIKFDPSEEIKNSDVIDYIVSNHPDLEKYLTEESLDFGQKNDGIIRFIVNKNQNDNEINARFKKLKNIYSRNVKKKRKNRKSL